MQMRRSDAMRKECEGRSPLVTKPDCTLQEKDEQCTGVAESNNKLLGFEHWSS